MKAGRILLGQVITVNIISTKPRPYHTSPNTWKNTLSVLLNVLYGSNCKQMTRRSRLTVFLQVTFSKNTLIKEKLQSFCKLEDTAETGQLS